MKKYVLPSISLALVAFSVMAVVMPPPAATALQGHTISLITNNASISRKATTLPGVYVAKPQAMMVIVPSAIDQKMVVRITISGTKMPVFMPEIRLEKR